MNDATVSQTTLDPVLCVAACRDAGTTDVYGVPCSLLDPVLNAVHGDSALTYTAASVEGEAVALAAGAWLRGGAPALVLMQNSGLGNAINPIVSLLLPYRIPAVLVVSWRGQPGRPDAAHHLPMGAATPGLLGLWDIPCHVVGTDGGPELFGRAVKEAEARGGPVVLLVPKGAMDAAPACRPSTPGRSMSGSPMFSFGLSSEPCTRSAVVDALRAHTTGVPVVSTTGYTSRSLAAGFDAPKHFYMQGSMGFAPAIALGLVRGTSDRVVCLDGDGALLMRLGSLATIGADRPAGFVHVLLDNGAYASTGGQATVSPSVDFPAVAFACGYRRTGTCGSPDGLDGAMAWALQGPGPTLLRVRAAAAEASAGPRPSMTHDDVARRFRAWHRAR